MKSKKEEFSIIGYADKDQYYVSRGLDRRKR